MTLRFVLWAAVSSRPQLEGDSLEKQLQDARDIVQNLNGQIVAELSVLGRSRSIVLFEDAAREIPAYAELRRLCEQRMFDVLVCRSLDRLGRTSALITTVAALVEEAGARIYEIENPTPLDGQGSDADLYIRAFRGAHSQAEVRRFQRHREFGMRARIRRGQRSGKAPYGYRISGHQRHSQTVLVPEEAAVVREIFRLYLKGWGMTRICDRLNAQGIPSPTGKLWRRSALHHVLHNPFYAGIVTWGRRSRRRTAEEKFAGRGQHEPILTEQEWQAVLQEQERRQHLHSRGQSGQRRFTGAVYCLRCGQSMISFGSNRETSRTPPGYRCKTYALAKQNKADTLPLCHNNYTSDAKIVAALRSKQEDIRQNGAEAVAAQLWQQRQSPDPAEVGRLQATLADLDGERRRLVTAYTRGRSLTVEEFEAQIADWQRRHDAAERRLAGLKQELSEAETEGEIEARLRLFTDLDIENGDPQEVRAVLAQTVRVWCEDSEIVRVSLL